jgi:phosphatidylserine/phosphatidylglycerophosphate/cardiolipin synthase-like enzyme
VSTNFFDVLTMWLGSGPSSPKYCQMFARDDVDEVVQLFGADLNGAPSDYLELELGIGARVAAPTNALVWRVPDLSVLTEEEKAAVRVAWPPLRSLSGAAFGPEDARGGGVNEQALLLEVFPPAFRRLEYLFSSLEVPLSPEDWDVPRAATPRWFWVWGFTEFQIRTRFQAIATEQWAPNPAPTIDGFMKGLAPIYLDAHEELGSFSEEHVRVRAFDSNGLPVDPDFVFDTFNRLAEDSDFSRLKTEHPQTTSPPYQAADRHVIVICDQQGNPYTPRPAPQEPLPPTDPEAGTVDAGRVLLQLSPGSGSHAFPEHGVLVLSGAEAAAMSGPVGLAMTGTHVRLGTAPHGTMGASITVDFAPRMFLRLRVLDYADWFPRNPNPRNRLHRYTEGNLVTPLIDGAAFFRELFRMIRATYKDVDPELPVAEFDPRAPVADAPPDGVGRAKVFLSNAWIQLHTPLLGRRGLISAPRVQDVAPEELPDFGQLMAGVRLVAAEPLPGLLDVAGATNGQRQWWMVSAAGTLPAGASVEIRQLVFADDFHGDDPRLPGELENADLFGILAPLSRDAPSSRAFASTDGRFVLPVVYALGREPMAVFRVTLWAPESPDPLARTYGQVTLPEPGDPFTRPAVDAPIDASRLRLEYEGVPGSVVLVLPAGTLVGSQAVVILNPRSGELVAEDHDPNPLAPIRIGLSDFAFADSALVGFLAPGARDPSECAQFFELYLGRPATDEQSAHPGEASAAAIQAGAAPAHPTEIGGLLREAITAGVDVRVLAWKDPTQFGIGSLTSTLGLVNAVNATWFGRRGQAVWDGTTRETFHVHHQKAAFIRTASLDFLAFLGGIDTTVGRWDTQAHRDPDAERPSSTWHDVQCKIEGRAAWDVYRNFMQRWNAANALPDIVGTDPGRTPLPAPDDPAWGPTPVVEDPLVTKANGPHAVQITRTLAPHLDAYGGSAPPLDIVDPDTGDLSSREAWRGVLESADRFLYIEEQYFWIRPHAEALNRWLRAKPDRFLFLVLPRRFADIDTADQMHYFLRRRALNLLLYGAEDIPDGTDPASLPGNVEPRVAMFHLASRENLAPIYVHSKLVLADDTWFTIGSANLTRRSWTLDSEINAACVDRRIMRGGHVSARRLRVDLLAEHLQLQRVETPLVEDPRDAFRLVREVLDGKRPWMRTHLLKVDLKFTHYGPFPDDFDPILGDAVNGLADPDGTEQHLEARLIDAAGAFAALKDASTGFRYGGLGRLRFTFDVSGLGRDPADVVVRVEMREVGAAPSQEVAMGPWPAASTVDAGVLRIGIDYLVRATALDATSLAPIGSTPEQPVFTPDFVTTVNLTF